MRKIAKPDKGEYSPHASVYIDLLPADGDVLLHLRENLVSTTRLIRSLPEAKLLHRYEPGKWTIKEILVHIVDD